MGRPKKQEKDCKIKFGISLDRELFDKMVKDKTKKSSLINGKAVVEKANSLKSRFKVKTMPVLG